jgi:type I restriction-modification system DNA methylase subunit
MRDMINETERISYVIKMRNLVFENDFLHNNIFMPFETAVFEAKKTNLGDFLKYIDKLTDDVVKKFHVKGRMYEYFLGHIIKRSKGSKKGGQVSDLGQHYTSRHIIKYIMAYIDPELNNNQVPSMIDAFCGSGGFLTEYIYYLNCKYDNTIDWTKNIQNIKGYDTDRQACKAARCDIMSLTDTFNEKAFKSELDVIQHKSSSFECDFNDKFHFNFTNPPYGGNKMNINSGKEINFVSENGFGETTPNRKTPDKFKKLMKSDKESLSLLHGMGILEKDGIYVGVLKEGVFFDKKYGDIRKALCENFSIDAIISIPQDDFLNTSTKTSILIFKNNGKATKSIKFWEIGINKNKDKTIKNLTEINPENKKIIKEFYAETYKFTEKKEEYMVVSIDDIKKNNYTFNVKNYIKENITVNKGFKLVDLGEIITYDIIKDKNGKYYQPHKKRKANDKTDDGLYTFYTSSFEPKKCNFLDYENKLCIILGTGGTGSIHLTKNFSCSSDNFVIQCKIDNNINEEYLTYIYYYIRSNWEYYKNKMFNGSTMGHVNKENLGKFNIPIPEDIETIKLYLDVLEPSNEALQSLQSLQSQKEKQICNTIKLLTMMGEKGVDYDEYKLGDIITMKSGDVNSSDITNTGEYPFYNAGLNNPIGSHNTYSFDGDEYILFIKSGGNSNKKISDSHALGYNYLVNGKIACNVAVYKLEIINNNISYKYLHYYLLSVKPIIQENSRYTTGNGNVDMDHLINMKIKVLKPDIIKQYGLDKDFEFVENLKNNINNTLNAEKLALEKLMKMVLENGIDKTKNPKTVIKKNKIEESSDSDSHNEKQKKKHKKEKSSKSKSDSESDSEKPKKKTKNNNKIK